MTVTVIQRGQPHCSAAVTTWGFAAFILKVTLPPTSRKVIPSDVISFLILPSYEFTTLHTSHPAAALFFLFRERDRSSCSRPVSPTPVLIPEAPLYLPHHLSPGYPSSSHRHSTILPLSMQTSSIVFFVFKFFKILSLPSGLRDLSSLTRN